MLLNDLIAAPNRLIGHDYTFVLWPQQWAAYNLSDPFNWEIHPFQRDQVEKIPSDPGIYSFVIQPRVAAHPHCSYLMYVGKTERPLRERFREYFNERQKVETGRPKIVRLLNQYQDYLHFCCSAITETDRISEIEEALLNAFIPPCNDQYPAAIHRPMKAFQ